MKSPLDKARDRYYSTHCYSMEKLTLDGYVIDVLMRDLAGHDRSPSAFLVYLMLWRKRKRHDNRVQLSYAELADATGLSKRAVQAAIGKLQKRKLVVATRASITAVPVYEVRKSWKPMKKKPQKSSGLHISTG